MSAKPDFTDYETVITESFCDAVATTVWDALGEATTPAEARAYIGAVEETDQGATPVVRIEGQWLPLGPAEMGPHNNLLGRDTADAHPSAAITGLDAALSILSADVMAALERGNASAMTFPTMAALTAQPIEGLATNQVATTACRAVASDNGGSTYFWSPDSTATADGGAILIPDSLPASGRWITTWPEITPQMYGAVGNGSTNDRAAIQAALDTGKSVYFPDGTYLIAGDPLLLTGNYRRIWGNSVRVIRAADDPSSEFFALNNLNYSSVSGFTLTHSPRTVAISGYAITVDDSLTVYISEISLIRVAGVAQLGETAKASRIHFSRIVATFDVAADHHIIDIRHVTGLHLADMHLAKSDDTSEAPGKAIVRVAPVRTGTGNTIDTILFSNFHAMSSTYGAGHSYGLFVDGSLNHAGNIWLTGVNFDKTSEAGIYLYAGGAEWAMVSDINSHGFRCDTANGGVGFKILNESTNTNTRIEQVRFTGGSLTYRDAPAIRIDNTGAGDINSILIATTDLDEATDATVEAAVEIGASGVTLNGLAFVYAETAEPVSNTTYAVKITRDIENFIFVNSSIIAPANAVLHYNGGAYSTCGRSRVIANNTKGSGSEATDIQRVTIASKAITVTSPIVIVTADPGDASGEINTIHGGYDGRRLTLKKVYGGDTVVLKNGTGNFVGSVDLTFGGTTWLELIYTSEANKWYRAN